MADLYPNIQFPSQSLSFLGELPAIMEETRMRGVRRETLADLNAGDADSLIKKGTQLLSRGDTDMGLKLLAEGRQRKAAEDRSLLDKMTIDWYLKGGPGGAGRAAPTAPGTVVEPDIPPATPGGGVPGAAPVPGGGAVPSWLPGAAAPVTTGAPGRRSELSPSEEILAAAEGPAPAAAPLTQLAQAGGAAPAPGAPGFDWGRVPIPQGNVIPPGVVPPPRVGQPPPGTGPLRFNPQLNPAQRDAAERAEQIKRQMLAIPPSSRTGQHFNALREDYKRQLDILAPPKDWKDWYQYNYDQEAKGRPTLDYTDWKRQESFAPEEAKEGLKIYTEAQKEVRKVNELEPVVGRMEALLNNPQFETGLGTANLNKGKAFLRNMAAQLEKSGITLPEGIKESIDAGTNSVQLREAFTSLANSAVFAKLGSLGNQISEGDRGFIEAAFPSLRMTKEGNQLILDYYKDLIARVRKVGEAAHGAYRGSRGRLNPLDMNEAIDAALKEGNVVRTKDGKLTPFGKRLQDIADKGSPDIAQAVRNGLNAMMPLQERPTQAPAVTAPPEGSPAVRRFEGPDGKIYRLEGGKLVPERGQGL